MHRNALRVSGHARLISGLVLATALTTGLVAPASAQSQRPSNVIHPKGQTRGLTLEQALDAVREAGKSGGPNERQESAAQVANSVSAVFIPQSGILAVTGNNSDNALTVSRNAAGALLVNNGAIAVRGPAATV